MNIPITFTHSGKQYSGHFQLVQGAASTAMYQLMIDKYYYGPLRYSEFVKGWVFDPAPGIEFMKELGECFGELIASHK